MGRPQNFKEILKKKLTKKQLELVPSSFDIVGSIVIFNDMPLELEKKEKSIGEAILLAHKNIETVCKKTKKYSGTYRLPKLKIIAGKRKKETVHKENGVLIKLNVEKVYFSTRSSNERLRIAKQVKEGEEILVMFSGCAPFPLVISKNSKAKDIYGIEINPIAHKYAVENLVLNRSKNIILINGDVREETPKLQKQFDRVLMPLPKEAESFLDVALGAVKSGGMIHFYDFLNENEFSLAEEKIKKSCFAAGKQYKISDLVKCGQYGPGIFRICVDFQVL